MVLDGFVNLLLHSTYKTKGHSRTNRSCDTTSDNATTSSDSGNNDSPCTSENTEDKTGPSISYMETPTSELQSSGEANQESATKSDLDSDSCSSLAIGESGEQMSPQAKDTPAADTDSAIDESPIASIGDFMVDSPYLAMVVLHSVSSLLSGIHSLRYKKKLIEQRLDS